MELKFTCRKCGKTGFADLSRETDFVHAPWYTDYKGLKHNCIYCRSCGAVHDTIGSLLGPIKLLFSRIPSKVIVTYEISAFKKLTRINNPDFITLTSVHPYILEAMEADGRLTEDEELTDEEPSVDFLLECLTDKNFIVRREAIITLRRFKDKRVVDSLIKALKDKHWDVRRNAAITLGDIGDSKAIGPLSELLGTETWEHLVRKEARIALEKLKK